MKQLQDLFYRLTARQRIILLAAALGVAGSLYYFSQWSTERDYQPLFTGLAPQDAGTITAKLKELGVEYRLKEGGATISVPSTRIAEVRLELAGAGLPATGRIGFELFDKANFGASEFTEQVNYQRAVEGELERSVMSISTVEHARVHVTAAKDSLYSESRQPAKASVLIKLKQGGSLTPQNVAAITQLAASAVPGLTADQVSVMDSSGNLLNRPKARGLTDGSEPSEAAVEYRKNIEREIQNKIAATLEPLLGPDHFRIGVSADVDLVSAEQSEETYDPTKSVMTSSQKSEDGPALASTSGVPGTASNVPNATANNSSGASSTNYSRRTESVSYQTSRLVKHSKLPQGGIKKLSLSVLVDHNLRWEGQKRVVEAPAPEKLSVIKDLVAAATGLNMDRGDQLVVEAFPFDATLRAEPPEGSGPPATSAPAAPGSMPLPPWLQKLMAQKNFVLIASIGAGAALLLLGGGFFFWRRSRKKKIAVQAAKVLDAAGHKELSPAEQMEAKLAEHAAGQSRKEAEALAAFNLPEAQTKKTEVLIKHIVAESKKDPTAVAHVIRSWLNGEYQR